MSISQKTTSRTRRHKRIRAKVVGNANRPRLCVFRSNTAFYAQVIDDGSCRTVASVDTRVAKGSSPMEKVVSAGSMLAEKLKKSGINSVVFDRGGFSYAGRIAVFANAVRAGGILF